MNTTRRMFQSFKRIHRRGQSMVEMALMMPLLVALVMGIIEFGWYVYSYSELNNAIRRGSEYASKSPPTTPSSKDDDSTDMCARAVKEKIVEYAFMHDIGDDDVRIVFPGKSIREVGVQIEVILRYDGPWLTPLGNYLFGDEMPLEFASRRSIVNTAPPEGYKEGCIK